MLDCGIAVRIALLASDTSLGGWIPGVACFDVDIRMSVLIGTGGTVTWWGRCVRIVDCVLVNP